MRGSISGDGFVPLDSNRYLRYTLLSVRA